MADDTLHPNGLYNPTLRFAFTNITSEDFTSYWGGQPIRIKAGQAVELPHHLAVKLTKELVDHILIGEAKLDEVNYYKVNQNAQANTYRSPKGLSLGVPAARKVWEDKICRQLAVDEESPEIQVLRAQMKEELMAQMNNETAKAPVAVPATVESGKLPEAFAELGKETSKPEPKPLRVKAL